jgi:hypothetical protein
MSDYKELLGRCINFSFYIFAALILSQAKLKTKELGPTEGLKEGYCFLKRGLYKPLTFL